MVYFAVVKLVTLIVMLVVCLGATSCMMPDPEKTRAKNEAVLFEEGFRVPFYKTTADGSYELDGESHPIFTAGLAAPKFELDAAGEGKVSIGDTDSQNRHLLYFVPSILTPNSLQQLRKLATWNTELQAAGITTIGIMGDPLAQIIDAKEKYTIGIPLLHDPGLTVAKKYGCAIDGSTFAQRTVVGIDQDGTVTFFERGFSFTGVKQILETFGASNSK